MTAPGPWPGCLDADDRAQMISELHDALDLLDDTGDPEPLETCLREWRVTAEALADPARAAVLKADSIPDDDFTEVGPP